MLLALRIIFVALFGIELSLTRFNKRQDKYYWFMLVLVFGVLGYFFYITFKRRLIAKRKFDPQFNTGRSA